MIKKFKEINLSRSTKCCLLYDKKKFMTRFLKIEAVTDFSADSWRDIWVPLYFNLIYLRKYWTIYHHYNFSVFFIMNGIETYDCTQVYKMIVFVNEDTKKNLDSYQYVHVKGVFEPFLGRRIYTFVWKT